MISRFLRNAFHLTQKRAFIVDALSKLNVDIVCGQIQRRGLVGVEIGTYRGHFAKALLDNLNIKKLYLIDPYEDYPAYEDNNYFPLARAERDAHRRLKGYKNVEWVKKYATDAAKDIPDSLDFVYIDGNHSYESVKEDIKTYYPKLREGGVLGGHDFYNGHCSEHDGVIQAVIEFAVKNKLRLYVQAPDFWVIK